MKNCYDICIYLKGVEKTCWLADLKIYYYIDVFPSIIFLEMVTYLYQEFKLCHNVIFYFNSIFFEQIKIYFFDA
jgi:hypothetical protein